MIFENLLLAPYSPELNPMELSTLFHYFDVTPWGENE
jgi:hypothetical protein